MQPRIYLNKISSLAIIDVLVNCMLGIGNQLNSRSMAIIDGKKIALEIQAEIRQQIALLSDRPPCLAVIIVGELPASKMYVQRKIKACSETGITSIYRAFGNEISEELLIVEIERLNAQENVDGILLQLPLPKHINPLKIISTIAPEKDVDGLHPTNVGKMLLGDTHTFFPCTPLGIKVLLERYQIDVASKHALIIGRSNLVGKPMAAILMQNAAGADATVTIAHSRTKNLIELSKTADIVIAAMGQPRFIKAEMIKSGAVVIDVGINKISAPNSAGYQIVGDVDFDAVKDKCAYITPVPGGVGPMTIAMLLSNTLKSYTNRSKAGVHR